MLRLGWMLALLLMVVSCSRRPKGNTAFYLNLGGEPTTLNPITSTDGYSSDVQNYIFESLLSRHDDTYEWVPTLATKWEVSKDKTKFTFHLRKGVLWQDGKPFTAEDVKYSFDVLFTPDWNNVHRRFSFENIKGVEVIDTHTVQFTVKSKIYSNFDVVAGGLAIIPKHFYTEKKKKSFFNKNLMGTGPYKLEKYHRGNRIVLVKNPNWWGTSIDHFKEKWQFPKIVLRWTQDATIALEMLKKGRYDFIGMQPDAFMKKAKGPMWGKTVHKVNTLNNSPKGYCFFGWNMKDKILKDKKVRRALAYLINRNLMIKKFEFGMSVPAVGPIYPGSPYADKTLKPIEFNPKKALKLLKQAGWSDSDGDNVLDKVIDGRKTALNITILEPSGRYMKYITIFKEDARKAGVIINAKQIEWNSFIKVVTEEKKYQGCRLCWSASVDWDPRQIWHSKSIDGGSNFVSYNNPAADKLIDRARYIFDRDERIKVLSKVEKMIVDDAPYAFLTFKSQSLYGHTDRIHKLKDTYKYTIGSPYWKFKSDLKSNQKLNLRAE